MKNAAIILAAGKGKRMKSDLPKVLHEIMGRPMVEHLIDTLLSLSMDKIVVVVGYKADLVKEKLSDYSNKVEFTLQSEQLGTGHAVLVTEEHFRDFEGNILVVAGDVPFLSAKTLLHLIAIHTDEKVAATVLSSSPPDPSGYGRIVRTKDTNIVEYIVEHKDANDDELTIGEINTGTFCFDSKYLFDSLKEIRADNSQNEYYLTNIMEILRRRGLKAAIYMTDDPYEALGVNSVEQMADLETRFGEKGRNL
ncbi:MAG: NTP transferase domain-containing protein [candidate division Zixibacteria bacterium]